jgi:O-antigen ligase
MSTIRAGLMLSVAFAVLAHGAVEPWSESLLIFLAALLFVAWCGVVIFRKTEIQLSPILAPVALLAGLALAQWSLGLSAYSYATRIEFLRLAAYALFAFLAVQCFRRTEDFRPFVWFLIFFGFAVALFGILQHLTFNGKLYWFRELREAGFPFGPYVNRNHFAGLMELIAPLGLALLLHRGVPRDQMPLLGLFAVFPVAALFLSASRGGIVSFLFQLVLLVFLSWSRPAGKRALALGLLVLFFAGTFIFWLGAVPTWERFLKTHSAEVTQGRRMGIVTDSWRIFLDHPWLGTGLGTFEAVYPRYETQYDGKIVNHAHNDYAELLAEAGLFGALCGLVFLFLLYRLCLFRGEQSISPFAGAVRLGALVGCSGLLIHGLVDFNLHIPSNALLFVLLSCLAVSTPRPSEVVPMPPKNK